MKSFRIWMTKRWRAAGRTHLILHFTERHPGHLVNRLRKLSMLLLLCGVLWNSREVRADIIVDVQDAMITAGGFGFVDVLIISSTGTDTLDYYFDDFQISLVGAPVSTLQFSNPQILTETGLGNYVFPTLNAGAINVITLTNSQFIADAGTLSFAGVGLTAATRLLPRLEVESVLGLGQTPAMANGEQFLISLLNSGDTLFNDDLGNFLTIDGSSAANTGLITIQGAAAVPEPGSLGVCAIGAAVIGWCMCRLRRKP